MQCHAADGNGDLYATGDFWGSANFDAISLNAAGDLDIFVCKLGEDGAFKWAKRMGWRDNESGKGIALDNEGNVYTVGNFEGTVDFDPGPDVVNLTSVDDSRDVFICKLDNDGNFKWAKSMGGGGLDDAAGIAIDGNDNVYVAGYFSGMAYFGTTELMSFGLHDIFISRLNKEGNFIWAGPMGGGGFDEPSSITVNSAGQIYIVGSFNGIADFDPGEEVENVSSVPVNRSDIFVVKLGSGGSLPVTLTSFTASTETPAAVLLRWSTSFELNAAHFEIERSTDARSWQIIGKVDARGESTRLQHYSFPDTGVGGIRYYRLRIVDLDGTYEYSGIVSLSAPVGSGSPLTVYPNPASGYLHITPSSASTISSLALFSLSGTRLMYYENFSDIGLDIAGLASGLYLLTIRYEDNRVETHRIVIRK